MPTPSPTAASPETGNSLLAALAPPFFDWLLSQGFLPALARRPDVLQELAGLLKPYLSLDPFPPPPPAIRVIFRLGQILDQPPGPFVDSGKTVVSTMKGELFFMATLASSEQVRVSVEFADSRGNPAEVTDPEWMTDNSELLSLEPAPDGKSCLVRAVGPLGTATVTLRADADTGEGITPILATGKIDVTAGRASVARLVFGTNEEQPEVPAPDAGTDPGTGDAGTAPDAGATAPDPAAGGGTAPAVGGTAAP